MSVEMYTYVPLVDESLIPRWLAGLRNLGMDCEMHPEITLGSHSGFLPFKIRVHDSAHDELNGVEFLSGFEYYAEDFSLDVETKNSQPEVSGFARLFGKKQAPQPFATIELDAKLKQCRKLLTFSWGSADLFELRLATVSSAVLAEITGGVSCYPADDIWYDRPATDALVEAVAYENSLSSKDFKVHRFERWL